MGDSVDPIRETSQRRAIDFTAKYWFPTPFQGAIFGLGVIWGGGGVGAALGSPVPWLLVYAAIGAAGASIFLILLTYSLVWMKNGQLRYAMGRYVNCSDIRGVTVRYVGYTDFMSLIPLPTIVPVVLLDDRSIEIENLAGYAGKNWGGKRVLKQAAVISTRAGLGVVANIARPDFDVEPRPKRALE